MGSQGRQRDDKSPSRECQDATDARCNRITNTCTLRLISLHSLSNRG